MPTYYHTKHGQCYHVQGCFHIAGAYLISGRNGLPPCNDCCSTDANKNAQNVSIVDSDASLLNDQTTKPMIESGEASRPNPFEIMSRDELAERTGLAAFKDEDMSSFAPYKMEHIRYIACALMNPDLQYSTVEELLQASKEDQVIEQYRVLLRHNIMKPPKGVKSLTELSLADISYYFMTRGSDKTHSVDNNTQWKQADVHALRQRAQQHLNQYTQYERQIICSMNPDGHERSEEEMALVYDFFSEALWDAYEQHLKEAGVSAEAICNTLNHIYIRNDCQFNKILHEGERQEESQQKESQQEESQQELSPTEKEAIKRWKEDKAIRGVTTHSVSNRTVLNEISLRSDAMDTSFVLMHEALHYLSTQLVRYHGNKSADFICGIAVDRSEKALPYRILQRLGFICNTRKREVLNEFLTNCLAEEMLKGTPNRRISRKGYADLEHQLRPCLPFFEKRPQLLRDYLHGNWSRIERSFSRNAPQPRSLSKIAKLLDYIYNGPNISHPKKDDAEVIRQRSIIQKRLDKQKQLEHLIREICSIEGH